MRPDPSEERSLDETIELVQKMPTSHYSVAKFMNCQVGRLLTRCVSENPKYLSELPKRAAQLKLQRYRELLLQCGCTKCQATHEWDRNRQAILDSNTCVAEPTASEYDEARRRKFFGGPSSESPGCKLPDKHVPVPAAITCLQHWHGSVRVICE